MTPAKTATAPVTDLPLKIRDALKNGLKTAGIAAKVETEALPPSKLHRVFVIAPLFKPLWASERQDLVWRILQGALSPEEQLHISTVMTLTPNEFKGKWDD